MDVELTKSDACGISKRYRTHSIAIINSSFDVADFPASCRIFLVLKFKYCSYSIRRNTVEK